MKCTVFSTIVWLTMLIARGFLGSNLQISLKRLVVFSSSVFFLVSRKLIEFFFCFVTSCYRIFLFFYSCVKGVVKNQFKDDFDKLFKHIAADQKKVISIVFFVCENIFSTVFQNHNDDSEYKFTHLLFLF